MVRRALALAALPFALSAIDRANAQDAEAILNARCAACHGRTAEGGLDRVSEERKTPEGWDMTLVRMTIMHGVEITADERRALVKHLADTQGLAPAETADWRYILERQPAVVETPPDEQLGVMCGRCHSYARVALQRRSEGEWRKLAHFHLGQWPTTEYQALGRDRDWWRIASDEIPPQLAKLYPLKTPAWDAWQDRASPDLSGSWRFVGHQPGAGSYQGYAEVSASGDDHYTTSIRSAYENGEELSGGGEAVLYTGYEWRGWDDAGGERSLEVFQVADDGNSMRGRWFVDGTDSIGGSILAVRVDGPPQVLAVQPPYIKAGASAELALHGVGLGETVDLGEGVTVDEVVSADGGTVVVKATAALDATVGQRDVRAGDAAGAALLTVYDQVASVTVEPAYDIARVGGGGGPLAPVPAVFDAVGWAVGPAGDVRIGVMPATFTVENFDELAAELDDVKFTGKMEPNGMFLPADAGPNPARPFQTNNAGNLKVIATVDDGGRTVQGEGQLLVTVQRWNDPPIR